MRKFIQRTILVIAALAIVFVVASIANADERKAGIPAMLGSFCWDKSELVEIKRIQLENDDAGFNAIMRDPETKCLVSTWVNMAPVPAFYAKTLETFRHGMPKASASKPCMTHDEYEFAADRSVKLYSWTSVDCPDDVPEARIQKPAPKPNRKPETKPLFKTKTPVRDI